MTYSRADREPQIAQFGLFPLAVTSVKPLSEHFVRISLAGASLHHAVDEISDGTGDVVDAYIKLMIAPPGSANGLVDIRLDDDWRHRYMSSTSAERGWLRTYTVRDSRMVSVSSVPAIHGQFQAAHSADLSLVNREVPRESVPEIDIDFVLHEDSVGHMGPGAAWAKDAQVGDNICVLAPMRGSLLWSSWNPGNASHIVVLADETAVPAALSITRMLPANSRADVLLEIPENGDIIPDELLGLDERFKAEHPQVSWHWLARNQESGIAERGSKLLSKLRELLGVSLPEQLPTVEKVDADELVWGLADENHNDLYVFIAGESSMIKSLRRLCVNDAGINKGNISFMGYWKMGRSEGA